MPAIALAPIAAFGVAILGMAMSGIVTRIIMGLGISITTYIGASIVTDYIFAQITGSFAGLWPQVVQFLALIKFDVAMNIIFGAINARLGLISLDGTVRRFTLQQPAA